MRRHREATTSCVDDPYLDGDLLTTGAYTELGLCDEADAFRVPAARGDRVVVTVRAAEPVELSLQAGFADAVATTARDADGVWRASVDLRVAEDTDVEVTVTRAGAATTYGLDVVVDPFEGAR